MKEKILQAPEPSLRNYCQLLSLGRSRVSLKTDRRAEYGPAQACRRSPQTSIGLSPDCPKPGDSGYEEVQCGQWCVGLDAQLFLRRDCG